MFSTGSRLRQLGLAVLVTAVLLILGGFQYGLPETATRPFTHFFPSDHYLPPNTHPIDILINQADTQLDYWSSRDSGDAATAARRYRKVRGRHPPPGWDRWCEYALRTQSPINEELFDQIYKDIEPFWAVPAAAIRARASSWHNVVSIRNGVATTRSADSYNDESLAVWFQALQEMQAELPDVDLAFNDRDEGRVVVSHEEISIALKAAAGSRHTRHPSAAKPILSDYTQYPPLSGPIPSRYHGWRSTELYWLQVRKACPVDGPARNASLGEDLSTPPRFSAPVSKSSYYHGYVSNWTTARSPCEQPNLRSLHGALIDPMFKSTTSLLFPIFSGSKITGVHNDILIPDAHHLSDSLEHVWNDPAAAGPMWEHKHAAAVWRGAASGGNHSKDNWARFHRHRLVSMMNATQVTAAEGLRYAWDPPFPPEMQAVFHQATALNIPLPNVTDYPLAALQTDPTTLGAWTARMSNAAFTHLMCFPQAMSVFGDGASCDYSADLFAVQPRLSMPELLQFRYLPDVDGASASPRWATYLRSTSLPFKSTIWSEWHDSRLIPWAHFVPLAPDLRDWWGVLEYFAGYDPDVKAYAEGELREEMGAAEGVAVDPADAQGGGASRGRKMSKAQLEGLRRWPHDGEARRIARQGSEWAGKVLRREDMLGYLWRVVLEYARVCDERREAMGWVGDL